MALRRLSLSTGRVFSVLILPQRHRSHPYWLLGTRPIAIGTDKMLSWALRACFRNQIPLARAAAKSCGVTSDVLEPAPARAGPRGARHS